MLSTREGSWLDSISVTVFYCWVKCLKYLVSCEASYLLFLSPCISNNHILLFEIKNLHICRCVTVIAPNSRSISSRRQKDVSYLKPNMFFVEEKTTNHNYLKVKHKRNHKSIKKIHELAVHKILPEEACRKIQEAWTTCVVVGSPCTFLSKGWILPSRVALLHLYLLLLWFDRTAAENKWQSCYRKVKGQRKTVITLSHWGFPLCKSGEGMN